jgi:hypothetical protein
MLRLYIYLWFTPCKQSTSQISKRLSSISPHIRKRFMLKIIRQLKYVCLIIDKNNHIYY